MVDHFDAHYGLLVYCLLGCVGVCECEAEVSFLFVLGGWWLITEWFGWEKSSTVA